MFWVFILREQNASLICFNISEETRFLKILTTPQKEESVCWDLLLEWLTKANYALCTCVVVLNISIFHLYILKHNVHSAAELMLTNVDDEQK